MTSLRRFVAVEVGGEMFVLILDARPNSLGVACQ